MKKFCPIVVAALMTGSVFAASPQGRGPRAAPARQAQIRQIQQRIADLYLSDFRERVGLNEEQFLRLGPIIRQFIQSRFRAANRRENLNRRLDQLLAQPHPSESDLQQLTEERAQFDNETGTMETRFVSRLRSELSARQIALVYDFNRKFFDERLPALLERARAAVAAPGGQRQRPPASPNPNRRPGDAFSDRN